MFSSKKDKGAPLMEGVAADAADAPPRALPDKPVNPVIAFICILLTVATGVLFIALYSRVFRLGATVYKLSVAHPTVDNVCIATAIVLLCLFYLFDISYWSGGLGSACRRLGLGLCVALYLVSKFFSANDSAYAPLGGFLIFMQLQTYVLKALFMPQASNGTVLKIFSLAYFATAVMALTLWVLWLFGVFGLTLHGDGINNQWSMDNRAAWSDELQCTEDWRTGSICLPAFMLWISPLLLVGAYTVLGMMMMLLGRTLSSETHGGSNMIQIMMALVAAAVCGLWLAASLSAAGGRLANLVMTASFGLIIAVVLLGLMTVGASQFTDSMGATPAVTKLYALTKSDVFNAILFFMLGPLFVAYFPVSFINQLIRKVGAKMSGGPIKTSGIEEKSKKFSIASLLTKKDAALMEVDSKKELQRQRWCKPLTEEEMKLPLTKAAHNVLEALELWQWSSVLINDMWIAIIIWGVKYGGTLTNMCMALLLEAMQGVPCWAVSCVITLVGVAMFLIPVVPAAAVYLTAGVLLIPTCGKDEAGTYAYFWSAAALAVALCYACKIIAHVIQQQVFGVGLGKSVSVRATVGVNSPTIKAVRYILSKPGFAPAKITILCGGPDWPTSVLCGILRLSLIQCVLGLLPVVVLVAPVALAASFQVRVDDGPDWAFAASMMLLACTVIQGGMMILALYFINKTGRDAADEIAKYEDDAEVAELEKKQAAEKLIFNEATEIAKMPVSMLATLVVGIMGYNVSAYMLMFKPSECFEPFALTDDLDDILCSNCPRAAVKNPGGFALGLLLVGIICMYVWQSWASRAVKTLMAERNGASA